MNQNSFFFIGLQSRVYAKSIASAMLIVVLGACVSASSLQAQQSPMGGASNSFDFPSEPVVFDPAVQQADHRSPALATEGIATPPSDVSGASNQLSQIWATVQAQWQQSGWQEKLSSMFAGADIGRMLGSLALVLGGYFGLVWLVRMVSGGPGKVPSEVLELLGSVPLSHKKQLKIVRLGSKLLLLIDSEDGTHSIGEISDPNEVEYLSSLCRGKSTQNAGVTRKIRQAAQQLADQTAPASPAGQTTSTPASANENHLSAILQALNGPRAGNAAVFEG